MEVSAVIPNWNGLRFLKPLLEDLRAQTQPFNHIIVVDNGSTDGSADWAEAAGLAVVRLPRNVGFAAAVNLGIRSATTEFVAVLNNDLRLHPQWLGNLSEGIGNHAFVAGKVLSASDPQVIDGTWDGVCRGGTAWRFGAGKPDGALWSESRSVLIPSFTAILLRRQMFLDAGGLDEAFGSYLEDVDFGIRCGLKGHTGAYLPEAVAWHIGSATRGAWNGETVRQIARNQLLLLSRHYPGPLLREFGWQIAVAHMLWGVLALRHGRAGAWVRGKVEGVLSFRKYRGTGSPGLRALLIASEEDIKKYQSSAGVDWYWRWYFSLT